MNLIFRSFIKRKKDGIFMATIGGLPTTSATDKRLEIIALTDEEIAIQSKKRKLEEKFADTLNQYPPKAAIVVFYVGLDSISRTAVGIPYSISQPEYHAEGANLGLGPLCLELGTILKRKEDPQDLEGRIYIPLSQIVGSPRRIELEDFYYLRK